MFQLQKATPCVGLSGVNSGKCVARRPRTRDTRAEFAPSQSFLGKCPPTAVATLQSIREAVAHSTCGPYAEIASETTDIINPAFSDEPRAKVRYPLVQAGSAAVSRSHSHVNTSYSVSTDADLFTAECLEWLARRWSLIPWPCRKAAFS